MKSEEFESRLRLKWRSIVLLVEPGIRGAPRWAFIGFGIQLFAGAVFALSPYGIRLFTDGVVEHRSGELIVGVIFTGGFFMLWWSVNMLGSLTSFVVGPRAGLYLSTRIAQLVDRLPGLEHFERPEYVSELETLERDRPILAGTAMQVLNLVAISVRMIVMFVLLTTVSPLFLLLPIAALAPYFADKSSVRYRKRIDDELAETARLANRYFALATTATPASELRTFGLPGEIAHRRAELADTVVRRTSRAGLVAMGTGALGQFVFAATFVVLMLVAVERAINGHTTPGQVLMVLLLAQQVQQQTALIAGNTGQLLRARLTAERLVWLEDEAERFRPAVTTGHPPEHLTDGIVLDHVSFSYPGTDSVVLADVSVHIPAGRSVAIVGENGAGKSTLAKLLSRMYEPSSGSITVDGAPLADFDIAEWRQRTTATFQDFARYQLRAGHAVGIGDLPRMDDDELATAALRDSGSDAVLGNLEQGLDTQLGRFFADGQDLSDGEWQKIALGRGRMRRGPLLLILDEPTASLDPLAESSLFDHYVRAARSAGHDFGTITLLVSHRFSTVRTAELIMVLDEGRITEFGSHEDLMSAHGRYSQLFSLQEQGYR